MAITTTARTNTVLPVAIAIKSHSFLLSSTLGPGAEKKKDNTAYVGQNLASPGWRHKNRPVFELPLSKSKCPSYHMCENKFSFTCKLNSFSYNSSWFIKRLSASLKWPIFEYIMSKNKKSIVPICKGHCLSHQFHSFLLWLRRFLVQNPCCSLQRPGTNIQIQRGCFRCRQRANQIEGAILVNFLLQRNSIKRDRSY